MDFQYKDKNITVSISNSENGHYFEYVKDGILTNIPLNSLLIGFNMFNLGVENKVQNLNDKGEIAGKVVKEELPYGKTDYDKIYNYIPSELADTLGQSIAKLCLNGSTRNEFLDKNCICFDENDNLKFIQPLIFDLESTETQITVTKRNGLGTVEYSIDGTNWQETTVFSALESNTQYTILGKTTDNKMVSEYSIFTKAVVENV